MIFHGICMYIEWSLTGYTTNCNARSEQSRLFCSWNFIGDDYDWYSNRTGLVLFEAIYRYIIEYKIK